MSGVNNIDELFKAKLGAREVAYSPSAWSGAEAMLNSHYKWLFVKKMAAVVSILLVTGSAVGVALLWSGSSVAPSAIQTAGTIGAIQPALVPSDEPTAAHAVVVEDRDQKDLGTSGNEQGAGGQGMVTAADSERGVSRPSTDGSMAHSKGTNPGAASGANKQTATSIDQPESASGSNFNALSQTDDHLSNDPSGTLADQEENRPASNNASIALPPDLAGMLDDLMPEPANHSSTSGQSSVSTEFASLRLGQRIQKLPIGEVGMTFDRDDSISGSATAAPAPISFQRLQLFAQFGIVGARGFHDLDAMRQAPGFGGYAQLDAKYHLNQSVYLNAAAGWFSRGSLTGTPAFTGNDGATVQVLPKQANFLQFYAGTGYRISARHSVGLGMAVSPLVGVWAQKESHYNDGRIQTSSVIDNTGMANLDASFVVNHQFSLSERWDMSTALQFGLFDQTDNNTFGTGAINDYNTLLRVGLSYRFTNR